MENSGLIYAGARARARFARSGHHTRLLKCADDITVHVSEYVLRRIVENFLTDVRPQTTWFR